MATIGFIDFIHIARWKTATPKSTINLWFILKPFLMKMSTNLLIAKFESSR